MDCGLLSKGPGGDSPVGEGTCFNDGGGDANFDAPGDGRESGDPAACPDPDLGRGPELDKVAKGLPLLPSLLVDR